MAGKPCHVTVRLNKKVRTFDQMVRKFLRKCKEEGIIKEVRDREFYVSKNKKRRKRKHAAKMRSAKKTNTKNIKDHR